MRRREENPHKRNLRNIFLFVFVYVLSATLLHDLRQGGLPLLADQVIELYTLPLRFMFRPLFPILKPFGLVVSDGAELPTPYGIIAGSLIWVFVLALLGIMFTPPKEKRRPFQQPWDN